MNNENIKCIKCGADNMANTKFCVKCGNSMQIQPVNQMNVVQPMVSQQPTVAPVSPVPTQVNTTQNVVPVNSNQNSVGKMNYFKYMINAFLKPYDSFKKEENNLSVFKNSAILSLILVGILTVLNLISTMINSVRVTSFWTDETKWVWENLKDVEYFKVIGQTLLIYLGVIAAISGVYYLASLVIKKNSSFVKLLSATATSFIPFAIATSILSPLLSLIHSYIGLAVTVAGFIYFLITLLELFNELIVIDNKNTRIYFHMVCLSILLIGGIFIIYKFVLGSITSGLGSLLG